MALPKSGGTADAPGVADAPLARSAATRRPRLFWSVMARATIGPSEPPTGMRPAATAAINALDTCAATGWTLFQSTLSASDLMVRATSVLRSAVTTRTCAQSTRRIASATSAASCSRAASSTPSVSDEELSVSSDLPWKRPFNASSCSLGVGQIGSAGDSSPSRPAACCAFNEAAACLAFAVQLVAVIARVTRRSELSPAASAIGTEYLRGVALVGVQPAFRELSRTCDRRGGRADCKRRDRRWFGRNLDDLQTVRWTGHDGAAVGLDAPRRRAQDDSEGMERGGRRRQRRHRNDDHTGDSQVGGDIERYVGDDAAVDQGVAVDLDRREHSRKRRTGDDGRHDIA